MANNRISDLNEKFVLYSDSAADPFPYSATINETGNKDDNALILLARSGSHNEKITYKNFKGALLDNVVFLTGNQLISGEKHFADPCTFLSTVYMNEVIDITQTGDISGNVFVGDTGLFELVGIGSPFVQRQAVPSGVLHLINTDDSVDNLLWAEDETSPDSSPFVITNNGSVGIGNTTPTHELDTVGNIRFYNASTPHYPKIQGTTNEVGINLENSQGNWTIYLDDSALDDMSVTNSLGFHGGISPTTKVVFDGSGNVGIGTTSPDFILDIESTDAICIPAGTTAERPSSPRDGAMRYNSTLTQYEGYLNSTWNPLGGVSTTTPAPSTPTSAGTVGEMITDGDFLYICVANNTWKRTPLSDW